MAQVNNNAESLSRELRKLKNIKSVDFRGLLSGNCESYVNLFRHLFCENNITFSRYIVEKGYDLSGLSDYKFMESVYKMMRDLFSLKPPINQNQFFSQGFTQRKLEMSTMLVCHVRKMIGELTCRTGKKSVHTQSLMKTSMKRPNSAPKQTRIIEFGDNFDDNDQYREEEEMDECEMQENRKKFSTHSSHNSHQVKKSKPSTKSSSFNEKSKPNKVRNVSDSPVHNSSDSERSNPANSYNYSQKINSVADGDGHWNGGDKYQPEVTSVSAYDSVPFAMESYLRPLNKLNGSTRPIDDREHHRFYDVKQYTPRSDMDVGIRHNEMRDAPQTGLDRVMQQLETVVARITLLENRMQRIESRLDNSYKNPSDWYPQQQPPLLPHSSYSSQNNQNYNQYYTGPHNYHDSNKMGSYRDHSVPPREPKNIISDFESNLHGHGNKLDSNKMYHDANVAGSVKTDYTKSYQHYGTNTTGTYKNDCDKQFQSTGTNLSSSIKTSAYGNSDLGSYRSHVSTDFSNSNGQKYVGTVPNYSDKRSLEMNNSSRENSYRANTVGKNAQPIHKLPNGIPPVHPMTKKSDDSGFDESRHGKSNVDKGDLGIQSQTDRIASLLSDTQKLLKISDEEL